MALKIGLVVNPIAGMGGSVGLKGTDGPRHAEAVRLGARPIAPARAARFLAGLAGIDVTVVTVAGPMGGDACAAAGLGCELVPSTAAGATSRADTAAAAQLLVAAGVELLAFVGGDGTARDVFGATGDAVPLLGVPAGVKMFSAVFAPTPDEAARAAAAFATTGATVEAEILDVDEEAYATGRLATRLFGIARVPGTPHLVAVGKQVVADGNEEAVKAAIADDVAERTAGRTVVLGPGSTVHRAGLALGVEGTLLGFDVVQGGRLLVRDGGARQIAPHVDSRTLVVLSPIGAQGYILGRGTQQLTPAILHRVDPRNLLVVATPAKLGATPVLRVDSGDPALDATLRGWRPVITGYRAARMVRVA